MVGSAQAFFNLKQPNDHRRWAVEQCRRGAETSAEKSFIGSVGGAAFVLCLSLSQALQGGLLHISSSTPLGIPSALGLATVSGASLVALRTSEAATAAVRATKIKRRRVRWNVEGSGGNGGRGVFSVVGDVGTALSSFATEALTHGGRSVDRGEAQVMAVGAGIFRFLLRGTFSGIAPSNLADLGAFNKKAFSLPATLDYATQKQRTAINQLGEVFGCHSCGKHKGPFISDHMPPVKVVKAANARLWRKVTNRTVTQRFYPQCKSCSSLQSVAVRLERYTLKYHHGSFRAHHATGLVLVLGVASLRRYHQELEDRGQGGGMGSGSVGAGVRTRVRELENRGQRGGMRRGSGGVAAGMKKENEWGPPEVQEVKVKKVPAATPKGYSHPKTQ